MKRNNFYSKAYNKIFFAPSIVGLFVTESTPDTAVDGKEQLEVHAEEPASATPFMAYLTTTVSLTDIVSSNRMSMITVFKLISSLR